MSKITPKKLLSLTARERQVLRVLCQGVGNQVLADTLGISINTVKNHLKSITAKLQVEDRLALILLAWKSRICPWPKELVRAVREKERQRHDQRLAQPHHGRTARL